MLKKLIHKKKDRDADDLKDGLKNFVDSPTPSSVTASSSAESRFQLSPHVLSEIDTELKNFEIMKPQRISGSNIQSSADATEVVFEEPRDPALKYLVDVKKFLAPSFEEHSTTTGKPGQGRNVKIIFETKDRPSLPDAAGKPSKNFTRTTSEACSIPGHGVYPGDREGLVVPQQLMNEQQLEKEQREAARVEKGIKDMQQSDEENYSPKSTRKERFADDGSLYGIVKTAKIAPTRYGVPPRWAADDESSTWAPRRYSQVASSDDESSICSHCSSILSAGASGYTSGTSNLTGASAYFNCTSTGFLPADTIAVKADEESSFFSEQTDGYTDSSAVSDDRSYSTADTSDDLEIQFDNSVQMLINRLSCADTYRILATDWIE